MNCEKICEEKLKALLNSNCEIKIFDCVDSTNKIAKEWASLGAREGSIVISHSQTAGRGRLGRSFFSPDGSGIYFSIILRPHFPTEDISLITPSAAVAVGGAIETVANKPTKIKWVNDIFINNKKVCGILSEAVFDVNDSSAEYVILGIGINLKAPTDGFPDDIKNIAGSVYEQKENPDTIKLVAQTVNNFFEIYKDLYSPKTINQYSKRMLFIGDEINYTQNNKKRSGKVLGIDNRYRLIVKNSVGEQIHLQSGEITIGSKNINN